MHFQCPVFVLASWFPAFTICFPLLLSFPICNFLVSSCGLFCRYTLEDWGNSFLLLVLSFSGIKSWCMWFWNVLLLVMITLVIELRWYLSDFSTIKLLFIINTYPVGDVFRLCKYLFSHCTVAHQFYFLFLNFFLNFRILFIFLYSRFLLVIYFIHINVYLSIPISQFITPPPPCCPPILASTNDSWLQQLFLRCLPNGKFLFPSFFLFVILNSIARKNYSFSPIYLLLIFFICKSSDKVVQPTTLYKSGIFVFFNHVLNWSIVNLQCCVSFRCTAKWFSYTCIYFSILIIDYLLIIFIIRELPAV